MPKISVITPCFNREQYIGETIESVIGQSLPDWEMIVVNDGSTDNSANVISSYLRKEPRIKLIQQENQGMQKARNRGFKACSSDSKYIIFLDSDDYLSSRALEKMSSYLDALPQVGLVFCHLIMRNQKGKERLSRRKRCVPTRFGIKEIPDSIPETPFISVGCGACHEPSSMIRKCIYEKTDGWREGECDGHEGLELFTEIALLSEIHLIPEGLYHYRLHDQQASTNINYENQAKKLLIKWTKGINIANENKAQYRELASFYRRRFVPYTWWKKRKKFWPKAVYLFLRSFLLVSWY